MIIMPDDHQPSPIERLLDWEMAYKLFKYSEEKIRNEPTNRNQDENNYA